MTAPIVQLLQGMIRAGEQSLHQIQDLVQSLPANSHLRHTLRNLQHSELLRLDMLHQIAAEMTKPPA